MQPEASLWQDCDALPALQVAQLRADRKDFVPDERYTQVLNMIRNGSFGWADYFSPLINSLEGLAGGDYYLCANDFIPYIEMQVRFCQRLRPVNTMPVTLSHLSCDCRQRLETVTGGSDWRQPQVFCLLFRVFYSRPRPTLFVRVDSFVSQLEASAVRRLGWRTVQCSVHDHNATQGCSTPRQSCASGYV